MKPPSLICLVTDRRRLAPRVPPEDALDRLVHFVGAAARAGVDLIQLRERDLAARDLAELTTRCVDQVDGRARVLVNDRFDVALAAGAHGVHLRADSVEAGAVRTASPQGFLIGQSVHAEVEAVDAGHAGAIDYLILGTLFQTGSKPEGHAVLDLRALERACGRVPVPVLAIGGITIDRIEAVARSGAGVAAIGLFIPADGVPIELHLNRTVQHVRRVFDSCRTGP